jgi:CheY-like chemotaxis protein
MTRILVIDDNEDFAELIRYFLQAEGYSVAIAHDGRLGLEIQRHQPADVIITDIFMPRQDGVETIAAVRKLTVS